MRYEKSKIVKKRFFRVVSYQFLVISGMILVGNGIILVETGMILVVFERFFLPPPLFLTQKQGFVFCLMSCVLGLIRVFSVKMRFFFLF
jgi:hypothetical protein